jgi:hypothetical protein
VWSVLTSEVFSEVFSEVSSGESEVLRKGLTSQGLPLDIPCACA